MTKKTKKAKEEPEDILALLKDEISLLEDVGEALALIQVMKVTARPELSCPHAFAEAVYRLADWGIENYKEHIDNLNRIFGETVLVKRGFS